MPHRESSLAESGFAAGRLDPGARRRENFPVAAMIVPRRLRGRIRAFYAFARTADDIADDPSRPPADRLAALNALAGEWAVKAAAEGLNPAHGHDLLAAFRQDALGVPIGSWQDLMAYCRLSAMPCARLLLDLHGERDPEAAAAADALAAALQVVNHLQDMGTDYRRLGRVYLPADWCREEGADPVDLAGCALSPALRRVADRTRGAAYDLLRTASLLPGRCVSLRLAMESAVVLAYARELLRLLGRADPLAGKVRLSRAARARLAIRAAGGTLMRRSWYDVKKPA